MFVFLNVSKNINGRNNKANQYIHYAYTWHPTLLMLYIVRKLIEIEILNDDLYNNETDMALYKRGDIYIGNNDNKMFKI
jgi:hypothetical protein